MARFLVKASEFKNVCKAVNDRKLAELKKEIIEILKKQDEKEVKKAVDYFNSQELHYTHLEKSLKSGKWIEKAGYGVGTVRVWKGKKYKKIAPGKWARVFDKEGRGTNIAIGKLIARVQKIDNVEDLMAFVMANKQRFVDENGVDLPVLDKLRAAVDARNGNVGSKEKTVEEKIKENPDYPFKPKTDKERAERAAFEKDRDDFIERMDKIRQENKAKGKKKSAEDQLKEYGFNAGEKVSYNGDRWEVAGVSLDSDGNAVGVSLTPDRQSGNLKSSNVTVDDIGKIKKEKPAEKKTEKVSGKEESDYVQKKREAKEGYWSDEFKERNMNNIKQKIATMKEDGASDKKIKAYLEETIETNSKDIPWRERAIEEGRIKGNQANDYRDTIQERTVRIENCKELLKEYESESKTYWIQDPRGNRLTNEDAKSRIIDNHMQIFKLNGSNESRKDMKIRELKNENEYLMDRLNPEDKAEVEIPDYASKLNSAESRKLTEELESVLESSDDIKVGQYKKPIGTFTKSGENTVEMPATKETKEMFETLNKFRSNEKSRPYMTEVYYDGDRLISTDGRRLAYIKVGELGFDKGHVRINTEGDKISIMEMPEWSKGNPYFPNVEKVIPVNNKQEIKLNNKVLKDKLKAMKKDGAYSKNSGNRVTLEFEDGKVLLDGTVVGTGNVDFGDKEKFMNFNAQFLMDSALTGDNASMFVSEDPTKAVSISTNSSDTIIMPMSNDEKVDYSKGRSSKEKEKTEKEEAIARNKKFNNELCKVFESRYGYDLVKNMVEHIDERLPSFSDEQLQREYTRLGLNFDKLMGKNATTINTVLDKKTNTDLKTAYLYSRVMKEHPEVKDKIVAELESRGISVKKSLFDDLIMDVFAADDEEEIEEELEEGETEYNDYSAEQPELFNSTEMKVREAYDRVCNCIM